MTTTAEPGMASNLLVLVDLVTEEHAPDWRDQALCAQTDPAVFYPEKGESPRPAKRVCRGCAVRPECLEYALANDEKFGVWGGTSDLDRRKIRKPTAARERAEAAAEQDEERPAA